MRWTRENAFDAHIQAAINAQSWVSLNKDQVTAFVKAIIAKESAFNPAAIRREAGGNASVGLMQVLYSTAKGLGYTGEIGDPAEGTGLFMPGSNIFLGVQLIKQLVDRLGPNLEAVASAYNGGVRPDIGFGARLTRPMKLCLARDASGNCTRYYDARAGEFGNQPYVDAVMAHYSYFWSQAQPSGAAAEAPTSAPLTIGEVASSPLPWMILAAIGALVFLAVKGGGR